MTLEVIYNQYTDGYRTQFTHKGQNYVADLVDTFDNGPECMIFKADEQGKVSEWKEQYACWFERTSKEALIASVKDFLGKRKYDNIYRDRFYN